VGNWLRFNSLALENVTRKKNPSEEGSLIGLNEKNLGGKSP